MDEAQVKRVLAWIAEHRSDLIVAALANRWMEGESDDHTPLPWLHGQNVRGEHNVYGPNHEDVTPPMVEFPHQAMRPGDCALIVRAVNMFCLGLGRCKTCKWWVVRPDTAHFLQRECRHEKVGSETDADGCANAFEDGVETGPDFGCIHWEEKPKEGLTSPAEPA